MRRPRAHCLMEGRGGGLEGVRPLFEVRGLLGGRGLVSVPYGVYGGVCATSAAAREALVGASRQLAGRVKADYVELRHRSGQEADLPTRSVYVTLSQPIESCEEANLNAIPRKQRRMTRQGLKHGLRPEFGLQHLDRFYDIYAHSVHALGSPVFPRRLFHAIGQEFGKDCELLTIWKDSVPVSGVLTLLFEDQVLPYYGGARQEGTAVPSDEVRYWELLCHSAKARYRTFDFGRRPEGTSAYHFSRH